LIINGIEFISHPHHNHLPTPDDIPFAFRLETPIVTMIQNTIETEMIAKIS
jgi:hypothetical protein